MVISEKHGFVWVSMPRCATHSLRDILCERYAGTFYVDASMMGGQGHHRHIPPPEYKDLFTWTCCRNPYTRAVSMYWYLKNHPKRVLKLDTFEDFCRAILERSQADRRGPLWPIWQQVAGRKMGAVVRLEHLQEDLEKLPFWRKGDEPVRWAPSTHSKPLAEILTPVCVDMILDWAGPDFADYGYSEEPPA